MDLFSKEKQEFHLPDAHLIYIPNSFSKLKLTFILIIYTET